MYIVYEITYLPITDRWKKVGQYFYKDDAMRAASSFRYWALLNTTTKRIESVEKADYISYRNRVLTTGPTTA